MKLLVVVALVALAKGDESYATGYDFHELSKIEEAAHRKYKINRL